MRSPFLLFLTILSLSVTGLAQAETRLALDLRADTDSMATAIRNDGGASAIRVPVSSEAATLERKVFALLNEQRRAQGLSELEWSEDVAAVARMHSHNMAAEKFFSHRGSDGSMVDTRADRVGLGQWRTIGENIAYMRGFDDPAALAVEKWMESPAHRRNLLGPNWRESAVGVAITADGTYYMTQVFLLRK